MNTMAKGKTSSSHEPLVRVIKRDTIPLYKSILFRVVALLGALVTCGILIALLGFNAFDVYKQMIIGSVGTTGALTITITTTIPLLITSLAIALAFKMRFWNIGANGQICLGAIASSFFALFFYDKIPQPWLFILMFLAGALAGGIWGMIPAVFKARWDTNETLFTLMLNYIAIYIIQYLREGPWMDPTMAGFPQIARFDKLVRLPKVFGVHIGWMVAIVLVVIMYIYMTRSKQGYEVAVVGESTNTARYAGMNVRKIIIRTMFLSGAFAGIAGMLQSSGADYTLVESVAGNTGFTAITIAWLSQLNPLVILVVSFLFSMLVKGCDSIQSTFGISNSASVMITGIILFFMLGCEFFINYRLVFRSGKEKAQ